MRIQPSSRFSTRAAADAPLAAKEYRFHEPIEQILEWAFFMPARDSEWRFPHGRIPARKRHRTTIRGTMHNSENEHCGSADSNYDTDRPKHHCANLSVILPDTPPSFDTPAANALLRLLLHVRDRRRQSETPDPVEAE